MTVPGLEFFRDQLAKRRDPQLPPGHAVHVHADDDPEMSVDSGGEIQLGYAEGQSFIIEYVDAGGNPSTRRITVWDIQEGRGGMPLLYAYCHERNAERSFRVDRIQNIVDLDGVVHEAPAEFLVECFGMSAALAGAVGSAGQAQTSEKAWRSMRHRMRHPAMLLATLSHADGYLHPGELGVATQYCLGLCKDLRPGEELHDKTQSYIRRIRPKPDALDAAIREVCNFAPHEVIQFLVACRDLVEADGDVHPREIECLEALAVDLTGVGLSGY